MARGQDQEESHDRQPDGPAVRVADETREAEEEQRERRGRRRQRVAEEKDEVGAEGPAGRSEESGCFSASERGEEEIGRKESEEIPQRHLEGPRLGERQQKPDPGRRVEDRRLLRREERLPRQDEPVPERQPAVLDRLAHRLAPRDLLVNDVTEDRVLRDRRPELLPVPGERRTLIGNVDRGVNPGGQHRFADEEERAEREEDGGPGPDRRDEPSREPQAGGGRAEVHGEQAQHQHEHAFRV